MAYGYDGCSASFGVTKTLYPMSSYFFISAFAKALYSVSLIYKVVGSGFDSDTISPPWALANIGSAKAPIIASLVGKPYLVCIIFVFGVPTVSGNTLFAINWNLSNGISIIVSLNFDSDLNFDSCSISLSILTSFVLPFALLIKSSLNSVKSLKGILETKPPLPNMAFLKSILAVRLLPVPVKT